MKTSVQAALRALSLAETFTEDRGAQAILAGVRVSVLGGESLVEDLAGEVAKADVGGWLSKNAPQFFQALRAAGEVMELDPEQRTVLGSILGPLEAIAREKVIASEDAADKQRCPPPACSCEIEQDKSRYAVRFYREAADGPETVYRAHAPGLDPDSIKVVRGPGAFEVTGMGMLANAKGERVTYYGLVHLRVSAIMEMTDENIAASTVTFDAESEVIEVRIPTTPPVEVPVKITRGTIKPPAPPSPLGLLA